MNKRERRKNKCRMKLDVGHRFVSLHGPLFTREIIVSNTVAVERMRDKGRATNRERKT